MLKKLARIAADAALTTSLGIETTNRSTADAGLQSQIDDILSNTDPAALDSLSELVAAYEAADANLSAAITAALGTHTSELAAEEAARIAADGVLTNDLATEVARATAAEAVNTAAHNAYVTSNDAALAAEIARAGAAEAAIQADVDANEAQIILDLGAEETRALAAEAAIQADVDANEAAALAGRVAIQADVDANEAAALAGRVAIQADVDQNEADADAAIAALDASTAAAFDALESVQDIPAGSIAYDGSAIVFLGSAGAEVVVGAGSIGASFKVKSKVASGDVTIAGDIEGNVGTTVTLSDNGAVTLVCDGAMWWIM
jgi:hypothetical protein